MYTAIEINNLSKQYRLGILNRSSFKNELKYFWSKFYNPKNMTLPKDHIWALKDVNLKVDQGEILGIIGKNGAGKSTLLKILSRITLPTLGTIKIKGKTASLLEVGTGFHPELTGRENIYLNGSIMGMTKFEIDKNFDKIIDFSGVETFLDTPVKRYSSGMYVRLAFSIAAHLNPEILFLDEVLAVGDVKFQKKCFERVGKLSVRGKTILIVSHNLLTIRRYCTKVAVLDKGKMNFIGSTNSAIEKYNIDLGINKNKTIFRNSIINQISIDTISREKHSIYIEKIILNVNFKNDNDIPNFTFGFQISKGPNSIISMNNDHNGYIIEKLKPFKALNIKFDLYNLSSGDYSVSIWLGSNGKDFEHHFEALNFKINPHKDNYFKDIPAQDNIISPKQIQWDIN